MPHDKTNIEGHEGRTKNKKFSMEEVLTLLTDVNFVYEGPTARKDIIGYLINGLSASDLREVSAHQVLELKYALLPEIYRQIEVQTGVGRAELEPRMQFFENQAYFMTTDKVIAGLEAFTQEIIKILGTPTLSFEVVGQSGFLDYKGMKEELQKRIDRQRFLDCETGCRPN